MIQELHEQQVIQYMNNRRIDRIIHLDVASNMVTTIEMYCIYDEEEWRRKYEGCKLSQKRVEQLKIQQRGPIEDWQLRKLKEEQVNSNILAKAKQSKFLDGISQDENEKFCLVTSMQFHQMHSNELLQALAQNEIQYLYDLKDRSIEEIMNRSKQDIIEEVEKNSKEMRLKNQGAERHEGEAKQRYMKWNVDMQNAYEICQEVFNQDRIPSVYTNGRSMGEIVERLGKEYNVTKKTIYKYLRRYLQGGSTKYALYNDYYIGNAIKNKEITKHIGRKSTGATKDCETGVIITEDIKRLFTFAICRWYERKGGHSLKDTYKMLINELFKKEKESDEGIVTGVLPIPTYRQFTNWYNKEYKDTSRCIISREGEKYFLNNKKGLTGDILSEVTGPMQLVYVDATMVDLYLIDHDTGHMIVYRPTLYLAMDCFSQMIVGVSVTLEPPGIMPLRTLLYNMLQDKQVYAREFDIEFKKEYWAAQGIPKIIMGDRGEMISDDFSSIVEDFNSTLKNSSPYLGAAKGLVEESFNTVNIDVNQWAPGYVNKKYHTRRQPDYRLDAKLDLRAFTQIIIKMIIHHNRKSIVNRKPTLEMLREGVKVTPIGLWEYGKRFSGVISYVSKEKAIIQLLRVEEVSLTPKGIRFKGGYYNAEHPDFYKYKTEARVNGVKKYTIRYDNRCLNYVFLLHEKENKIILCNLDLNFHESKNILNKSAEEVQVYEEEVKKLADSQAREQIENDNEFIEGRGIIIDKMKKENADVKLSLKDTKKYKQEVRNNAKNNNALNNKISGRKPIMMTPLVDNARDSEYIPDNDDLLMDVANEVHKEAGVE